MSGKSTACIGLAVGAILCASPLQAQTIENINSEYSTARLIVASSSRDARVNVGVARLTGELTENGDRQPTAIHFQIYPADKDPKKEVLPGSASYNENAWNNTDIRFQSQHVERIDENSVRVSGTLTATYITRWGDYGPFHFLGPTWETPVLHTGTQQVTFVLERPGQVETGEWIATSSVSRSAFPALWNAVVTTNWAPFVADGKRVAPLPRTDIRCTVPLDTNAEDFRGEVCSGTTLATTPEPEGPQSAAQGKHASQAMAEELQIRLYIRLVQRP
jgi:hypothetical protein